MAQQTAMQRLLNYICVARDLGANEINAIKLIHLIEEAKKTEKEQIMKANIDGYNEAQNYGETSAEDYYNNNYKKQIMKQCKKCKENRELSQYTRKTSNADNLNAICKICKNEEDKQRRLAKKYDKQFEII